MRTLLLTGESTRLPAGNRPRPLAAGFGLTRRWLLAAGLGLLGMQAAQAQALNYQTTNAATATSTYTDLGVGGTAVSMANTDDANSAAQNIGFSFSYNGSAFTQFVMNTNGLIRLGSSAPSAAALFPTFAQTPELGPANSGNIADVNLLMPFNFDLTAGTGTPDYRVSTTGAPGSQVCTIQWKNVADKAKAVSSTNATVVANTYANMAFQIKLYEGTNVIEFVYNSATAGTAAAAKYIVAGIKGSGSASGQTVLATKASTLAWSTATFITGGYPTAALGNALNVRPTPGPDAGRVYRFVPTYANDATITAVYTLNKLPLPSGAPHIVRAAIRNNGTATFSGQQATLTVVNTTTLATAFTETKSVINAAAGATAVVTFTGYTPPSTGTYSVTVTVPTDENNTNNSLGETQVVNNTDYSYIAPPGLPFTARGFNASTNVNAFVARFSTSTARNITGVRAQIVDFIGTANATQDVTVGKTVYGVLVDATTGALLGRSNDYVVTSADVTANGGNGTLKSFTLQTPVTLPAGDFMVGLAQVHPAGATKVYFPIGAQTETPSRSNTFFTVGISPSTAPTDLYPTASIRMMIEAITADAPACVPATALSATSVTNTTAIINFTASGTATDYTVTYTPLAGAPVTVTPNPTASPINLTGLTPGTQYTVSITSNCAGSTTATPATVTFTTLQSNDASTEIVYTQGQLPIPFGAPHVVRAIVRNQGVNTLTNLPVTLNVSGANTFTNTQTVASLAPGATATVTFAGYTPTATGNNTVSVSVGADDFAANDTQSMAQVVSNTTYGYATVGAGASSSVGFNTGSGLLLSRFSTTASRNVTAVNIFLSGGTTVGKTVYAVVLNSTGTILGQTANYVVQAADANTLKAFTFATPVTLTTGNFFVGIAQTANAAGYFPLGTQTENPTRSGAYFIAALAGGATTDVTANNLGRFYIEAVTADLPPCAPVTGVTATAVTGTTATLNFTAPAGGANDYTVTLSPAGGTFNGNPTTSPVAISTLTPGTAYTATIVSNCGGGLSSTPVTFTFSTVPTNDQCSGSAPAITCGSTVNGTTLGSTSTNDPVGTYGGVQIYPASGGVFYTFQGTGANVTMGLCSSVPGFDSELFVFTGCGTSPTAVAADDDGCGGGGTSQVSFVSDAGTTYYVYVTGWNGARGNFTLTTSCTPLTDKVVSLTESISGAYRNVTIVGGGVANLNGNLQVQGTLTVQNGGRLIADCVNTIFGSGNFVLAAGAELQVCDPQGIENNGLSFLQVDGTRSFSNDANYVYNGTFGAQLTGSGLPSRVRNLTLNNVDGLTLSQALSVPQVVRLQSGDLATGGNALTLLSDVNGTALVVNTGGVVTGAGTMQRAINGNPGLAYRHYSAPVSNTTLADLTTTGFAPQLSQAAAYNTSATPGTVTPFPNIFGYDETRVGTVVNNQPAFDKGWFAPLSASTPMTVNRGYTVSITNSAIVDFVGTFNTGAQASGTLSRGIDPNAGWQLLGNPYPSPLDWSTVGAGQRPGMDAAMYVFQATGVYVGNYRSFVNGIGASPLIDAGQGYFTRVTTPGGSGSVNLTNANRVTTFGPQPTFGRGTADTRPQLRLEVKGAGIADDASLYFEQGATAGVDVAYDAVKLANPSGLNLASRLGNQELAINGLPSLIGARDILVPLSLRAPQAGSFSFEVADLANFGSATVYLRDAATGREQQLSAGTRYAFTLATALAGDTRFALVFRPSGVTATHSAFEAGLVSVYPNPAHARFAVLLPPVAGQHVVQATLLNALGQTVQTRAIALTAAGATAEFDTRGLANGVYVLRLQAENQVLTKRVVVE
jgi:hypothetical protein